ncbi:MAG: hypothetical protein ACI4A8_10870 [Muribaculaceae bacterium]
MEFLKRLFQRKITEPTEKFYGDDRDLVVARHIVLNEMGAGSQYNCAIDADGIGAGSDRHVHAVVVLSDEKRRLLLAIARQLALVCHYPNFDESAAEKGEQANRTVISIVDSKCRTAESLNGLENEIRGELFGNLPDYALCRKMVFADSSIPTAANGQEGSFVDIELNLVGIAEGTTAGQYAESVAADASAIVTVISKETIGNDYSGISTEIGLLRPMMVNTVYRIGGTFLSIRKADVTVAANYSTAINDYCRIVKMNKMLGNWQQDKAKNPDGKELRLSNLLCGDHLETKARSLRTMCKASTFDLKAEIEENMELLARLEHSRWNVEKLVMGYRPYTAKELDDDCKAFTEGASKVNALRNKLKNEQKVHLDIRSFASLLHYHFDSVRYDYFLTLLIPSVLKRETKLK